MTLARSALALLVLACLAACSYDKGKSTATRRMAPTTASTNGTAAASTAEYCSASLAIEAAPPPNIDANASAADQASQVRAYASTQLKPLADKVLALAPAAIKGDLQLMVGAVDTAASTGDPAGFDAAEYKAAEKEVHAHDLQNCGWTKENVQALEYAFAGLPATVKAGAVSFDLTNGGTEMHELAVIEKKKGTSESFDQILALRDQAAQEKLATFAGGIDATKPGETGFKVLDLQPGDYLIACFLSVGSTPDKFAANANIPGPPHFTKGMKRELKVT
jgi:hypothetical protein